MAARAKRNPDRVTGAIVERWFDSAWHYSLQSNRARLNPEDAPG